MTMRTGRPEQIATVARPTEVAGVEAYFDEAGTTGEATDPDQQNLLFAAVVLPAGVAHDFWLSAKDAWLRAGAALPQRTESVELKGSELYGGKGPWRRVALEARTEVLDALFGAIVDNKIPVMWDGAPKHLWSVAPESGTPSGNQHKPFYNSFLLAFCNSLYHLLECAYPSGPIRLVGDANSWVSADRRLSVRGHRWSRMQGGGVEFLSSRNERGLQVADVLVHTLYRANKAIVPNPSLPAPMLSNTDRMAETFHRRIEEAGLWVPVAITLANLRTEVTV